jgi:antitoxin (DNA-binding transcriptional repressor) of toxin-antitoxin stability system
MIAAFAGWSDASDSATRAIRYVARAYAATRFASIDAEDFFDFTQLRPIVSVHAERKRTLSWPANEFFYWKARDPGSRDVVLMVGVEPHLRWRHFASLVLQVAETSNVELFVSLGALLDAVRHGESILIMDCGRPIARIVPVTSTSDEATDDRATHLERNGVLRLPTSKPDMTLIKTAPPSLAKNASSVNALLRERDETR